MNPHPNDVINALCHERLYPFVRMMFEATEGEGTYSESKVVRAMCAAIEHAILGPHNRVLITLPPRQLKSFVTSICLPAWLMGRDPTKKVIVASYARDLADELSWTFRRVINSDAFSEVFPDFGIDPSGDRAMLTKTPAGGYRIATGRGGAVTGRGCDVLIVDDILKADEARSAIMRENAIEFYRSSLLSRFNNRAEGKVIIVQQRLHEDDLAGYVLSKGGFKHINLPAIADQVITLDLGFGDVHQFEPGDLLDPIRLSRDELDRQRIEMGEIAFNSQYMQNPILPGGNIIKMEVFETYSESYSRADYLHVVQSWDTAFDAEATNDYSVCETFGFRDGKWELMDVFRRKLRYPDLKAAVIRLQKEFEANAVVIERASSGKPLLQELKEDDYLPNCWHGLTPKEDKETRVWAITTKLEERPIRLPAEETWLADFRHELKGFPNTRYDDQVDAFSQFMRFIYGRAWRVQLETNPVTGRRRSMRRRKSRRR